MWMWRMSGILCGIWSGTSYLVLLHTFMHTYAVVVVYIFVYYMPCCHAQWYYETNKRKCDWKKGWCYIHINVPLLCVHFHFYSGKSNRFGTESSTNLLNLHKRCSDGDGEIRRRLNDWVIYFRSFLKLNLILNFRCL